MYTLMLSKEITEERRPSRAFGLSVRVATTSHQPYGISHTNLHKYRKYNQERHTAFITFHHRALNPFEADPTGLAVHPHLTREHHPRRQKHLPPMVCRIHRWADPSPRPSPRQQLACLTVLMVRIEHDRGFPQADRTTSRVSTDVISQL